MDDLSLLEQKKYEEMWNHTDYRVNSPGYESVPLFFDAFKRHLEEGDSLTDYGCGCGLAALRFLERGLKVKLVDIAKNCLEDKIFSLTLLRPDELSFTEASLWELPDSLGESDWVYCADVLEHLPTEKTDSVLSQIASRTRKGGLFQVFHKDESFGELIGKPLHLTIESEEWWHKRISSHFDLLVAIPLIPAIRTTYLVASKSH